MFALTKASFRSLCGCLRCFLLVALGCFSTGHALAKGGTPTLLLSNAQPTLVVNGLVPVWTEEGRDATVLQAVQALPGFQNRSVRSLVHLTDSNTVWLSLNLTRKAGETGDWVLDIPVPFLDSVTLYQRGTGDTWVAQHAGDSVAHDQWSHERLSPSFHLNLPEGQATPVLLQVRNYTNSAIPIYISRDTAHDRRHIQEVVVLGWALGILFAISCLSLVRYQQYRYPSDLAALAYGLVVTTTVAQINGVLNATLLQSWPFVANYATRMLPTIAVGASLIYMRHLYVLSIHHHRFDRIMGAIGWTAVTLSPVALLLMPERLRVIESVLFFLATAVALEAAFLSWRAGSAIWRWMALATVPQGLCLLWYAAEYLGWVAPLWQFRYFTAAAVTISVPVLAYALSLITRDRKDRQQRIRQLDTQDALTGLLNRAAFDEQLVKALQRVHNDGEPVAMAIVQLVNHQKIVETFGSVVAEQCELRSVIKLHRVLRDVDPASRLGTGTFALLLEGVRTRDQLNKRMVKLIASGLTPEPGVQPSVILNFHAACVLFHEQPLEPSLAIIELSDLLADIRPGTRRPIRFIEAAKTMPIRADDALRMLEDRDPPA